MKILAGFMLGFALSVMLSGFKVVPVAREYETHLGGYRRGELE